MYILIGYAFINLLAFILYGMDKQKAKNRQWRISEKMLLGIAILGGAVGAYWGMTTFRHKTKHWYFRYPVPVLAAAQIALLCYFLFV